MSFKRKLLLLFTVALLVLSSFNMVQAKNRWNNNNDNGKDGEFTDVDDDYAYDYIMMMIEYGIINGYDDGSFKPNNTVSRGEFAKMMVLTLGMDLQYPAVPYFQDVKSTDWEYPFVETAKTYLTMYKSNNLFYYKPDTASLREDLAVALVKALGYSTSQADLSILDQFSDKDQISPNLRPYVAIAVKENIMIGNGKSFNPTSAIKRKDVAVLLGRLITSEKVTFDEEKVVIGDPATTVQTPTLTATTGSGKVNLVWTKTASTNFEYYKVAVSATDSTPSYPENGYATCNTDINDIDYSLKAGDTISDGLVLQAGGSYYVAITTCYSGGKYTSNVVRVTVPQPDTATTQTPVLTATADSSKVNLVWSKTAATNFTYYKVVVSATDSTPSYPDNGYATYITDVNDIDYSIKAGDTISDGLVLQAGGSYYVAITACYSGGKYTSNVVRVTLPLPNTTTSQTPVMTANTDGGKVNLFWSKINSTNFGYYTVVISATDSTPSYPENGYMTTIGDINDLDYSFKAGDVYSDGTVIQAGATYYVAVTAGYTNGKYTSNVVRVTVPQPTAAVSQTPILASATDASKVYLNWTKTPSDGFQYYKVVLSKTDSTPSYPENGYLTFITDVNDVDFFFSAGAGYSDGTTITSGSLYYVSITACYTSGNYTSNVKTIVIP